MRRPGQIVKACSELGGAHASFPGSAWERTAPEALPRAGGV